MPIKARDFASRWAIHYNSSAKTPQQVLDDLKLDGIHVRNYVIKEMTSRDTVGNMRFDRVMLIETPEDKDYKLYFPETDQTQGRYAEWPYSLDPYQYAESPPLRQGGPSLQDETRHYDRRIDPVSKRVS